MKRRYFRDDLSAFERTDYVRPSSTAHKGKCSCGVETSKSVQGIGWMCSECYSAWMREQFQRAVAPR